MVLSLLIQFQPFLRFWVPYLDGSSSRVLGASVSTLLEILVDKSMIKTA